MVDTSEPIDVRQLLRESSVDELNRLAEGYFAREKDLTYYLSKPFGAIDETPQLLINFAVLLQGLAIFKGATVLEFGAGTCWAARFLTQLGCRVVALDVSPTALRIGKELYGRQPVSGDQPEPEFLLFNGHHIELPDNSMDRIMCNDALHHIPNSREVLQELGRVLRDGGIAGFAEPGPEHSRSPQSQSEMRTFKVLENDVHVEQIWGDARDAGFTEMKLAIFNVPPFHLDLDEFTEFLKGALPSRSYAEATVRYMQNQRTFFLYKGNVGRADSRFRAGLIAAISVTPTQITAQAGETIRVWARVENNSHSVWLPRSVGPGGVQLGCHVYDSEGNIYHHSFHWEALTPGEGRKIMPGEAVELEVNLPPLNHGSYALEFDLVSNDVCWFARNGSPTVSVRASVG